MSHYILAWYDKKESDKWFISPKRFIIEENKDNVISGIFLRDIWYNYDIGNGKFKNDINFMLIETKYQDKYVWNDINTNSINNEYESSMEDKPKNTALNSYYFTLEKDVINNYAKELLKINKHGVSKKLMLKNKENNIEVNLLFDLYNYDNKLVLMTLPRFKIYI